MSIDSIDRVLISPQVTNAIKFTVRKEGSKEISISIAASTERKFNLSSEPSPFHALFTWAPSLCGLLLDGWHI